MNIWKWLSFSKLSNQDLYKILKLREEVFVLEQQCFYQDIDDLDYDAWHLMALNSTQSLIAYLRVVEPGIKYQEPALGRVIVRQQNRSVGLGNKLVLEGVRRTCIQFPGQNIRISAQQHLAGFYRRLGFKETNKCYLEDGFPHVEMYWETE